PRAGMARHSWSLSMNRLQALLHPASLIVVGGSDRAGSLGAALLSAIKAGGVEGPVYAVNPRRIDGAGVSWSESVAAAPAVADLAIIATPASSVPGVLAALGE